MFGYQATSEGVAFYVLLISRMKSISKKKFEELEAKAPGSTLTGWIQLNYTHVTLDKTIHENGKTLAVPQHNVELTLALLSTDNVVDWADVAFHFAPAGTICDKVPEKLYHSKVLLLRQLLTKKLITEPDNRTARRYLDILERRDADRWAAKKQAMQVKATAEQPEGKKSGPISVEFTIA